MGPGYLKRRASLQQRPHRKIRIPKRRARYPETSKQEDNNEHSLRLHRRRYSWEQEEEGEQSVDSGSGNESTSAGSEDTYITQYYYEGREITPVEAYGSIDEVLARVMACESAAPGDTNMVTGPDNRKENAPERLHPRLITGLQDSKLNKFTEKETPTPLTQVSLEEEAHSGEPLTGDKTDVEPEYYDEGGFADATARSGPTAVETHLDTKDVPNEYQKATNADTTIANERSATDDAVEPEDSTPVKILGILDQTFTPPILQEPLALGFRTATSPTTSNDSTASEWSSVEEHNEEPDLVTEDDYNPNANFVGLNPSINPGIRRWSQEGPKVRRNIVHNSILAQPRDTDYKLPPKMLRTFDIKTRKISPSPTPSTKTSTANTALTVIRRQPTPFIRFKSISGSDKAKLSPSSANSEHLDIEEEDARRVLRESYEQIYQQGKKPSQRRLRSLVHRASRAFWEEKYKVSKVDDNIKTFNPDGDRENTMHNLRVDSEDMEEHQRLVDMTQRQRWHRLYRYDSPRCNAYSPIAQDPPSFVPIKHGSIPENASIYDTYECGSGEEIYLDGAEDGDDDNTANQRFLTHKQKKAEVDRAVFWVKDIMGEKTKGDHTYYLVCWWNKPYPKNWSWEDSLWIHAPKAKARFDSYREMRESKKVFGIFR